MKLQTPVEIPNDDFKIGLQDHILVLGSCFAEHIGRHLEEYKFSCVTNPFGVLYNPESIRLALSVIANQSEGKAYPQSYFFQSGGLWHSWLHSSLFSGTSLEKCKSNITTALQTIVPTFRQTYAIILTFGTNICYQLKSNGLVVGNCHRQPANLFEEKALGINEIVTSYTSLLNSLFAALPQLRILFTISPYRYQKYGMHRSQLSKATLQLAVDELVKKYPNRCYYFPSYEIILDELRDYRFYDEDMLHPSEQAINYVVEQFSSYAFDEKALAFLAEWLPIKRAIGHRPLHPESTEYRIFIEKLNNKIIDLNKKYPNLAFQKEQSEIESLLKQFLR